MAFEPQNVATIDYPDEELGYAQDAWAVVDRSVVDWLDEVASTTPRE